MAPIFYSYTNFYYCIPIESTLHKMSFLNDATLEAFARGIITQRSILDVAAALDPPLTVSLLFHIGIVKNIQFLVSIFNFIRVCLKVNFRTLQHFNTCSIHNK